MELDAQIEKLELKTGDLVVLRLSHHPTAENAQLLRSALKAAGVVVGVIMLGPDQSIEQFNEEKLASIGLQRIKKESE